MPASCLARLRIARRWRGFLTLQNASNSSAAPGSFSPAEAAAAKGRQDAEAGRFAENTFPEGSLEDEAYQNAYMKVQTARVVQMKPPADAGAASDVEMAA
jgi:hypothetical protein